MNKKDSPAVRREKQKRLPFWWPRRKDGVWEGAEKQIYRPYSFYKMGKTTKAQTINL